MGYYFVGSRHISPWRRQPGPVRCPTAGRRPQQVDGMLGQL